MNIPLTNINSLNTNKDERFPWNWITIPVMKMIMITIHLSQCRLDQLPLQGPVMIMHLNSMKYRKFGKYHPQGPNRQVNMPIISKLQQFNPEKRIIKYLHIQPLEEESKEATNVESCITFFSQILNAPQITASKGNIKFPSGYCFDCGLPHSSTTSCWRRQSSQYRGYERDFNEAIGERKVLLRKVENKGVEEAEKVSSITRGIEEEPICKQQKVNQGQMVNFAFMMLSHKIQISAEKRAKAYFQRMYPLPSVPLPPSHLSMVQETYRILLLPEEPLRLYLQTISAAKKLQEFNNSMKLLNLKFNNHPYVRKAALKLKNAYEQ